MKRTARFVILMSTAALTVLLALAWWFTPVLLPHLCEHHSPICEFAIRGSRKAQAVPPAPDFSTRFPHGYLTALRICRWPIYSQREKVMALNVLAEFVYEGDDEVCAQCLAEIRRMQTDAKYESHCQWLLSIGVIKERIERMR
jgi:hypothetical protein